jgi:hypothetical protein
VADLEGLAKDEFWAYLDNSDWYHAYDATGNLPRDNQGENRIILIVARQLAASPPRHHA